MVTLPPRAGPRPRTTAVTPHSQLDQQPADARYLEDVLQRSARLSGVVEAESGISVPGARALLMAPGVPAGPEEAFLVGREFCHGHAQGDHSLHLCLPVPLAASVQEAGWGEFHLLVESGRLPRTVVMLYAPRDPAEAEIAVALVRAAHDFARGAATPALPPPTDPPRPDPLRTDEAPAMTEHMSMNTIVHAAFRRDLARYDAALAAFPAGSQHRADQLVRAWHFFEHELHTHHGYEEEYFWPALQQTDADLAVVEHLDGEHEAMRQALARATTTMEALQADPSAERAATARTAVAELREVLLAHLVHEEADLEPISVAYKDAAPMKSATRQVIRKHLPDLGDLVAWLQDGAGENEKAALRRELPAPVLFLFGTFRSRRYRREIAPVWGA